MYQELFLITWPRLENMGILNGISNGILKKSIFITLNELFSPWMRSTHWKKYGNPRQPWALYPRPWIDALGKLAKSSSKKTSSSGGVARFWRCFLACGKPKTLAGTADFADLVTKMNFSKVSNDDPKKHPQVRRLRVIPMGHAGCLPVIAWSWLVYPLELCFSP